MRAVTIREQQILVAERPDPAPGAGEVLVRVRAAGLNGADMLQRRGLYPAPPGSPPDIPGLELAGEVQALGPGAERFAAGERVMAIVGGGGQAELAVVHERQLMPVPSSLDWPPAGGLPEVFTTAHDALFGQARLRPGERLLVHGGAGGVGTAAIQLAAATGASVTATVRREQLRAQVASLGARAIAPEGFAEHGPFDAILELVGAGNLAENLQALAVGGRIVVIGVSAGAKSEINLLALMAKRARIHGSTLRARPLEEKALAARLLEREVLPLFEPAATAGGGESGGGPGGGGPGGGGPGRGESGGGPGRGGPGRGESRGGGPGDSRPGRGGAGGAALSVPIAETFALDDAPAAYERFAAGGKLGKIVLTL